VDTRSQRKAVRENYVGIPSNWVVDSEWGVWIGSWEKYDSILSAWVKKVPISGTEVAGRKRGRVGVRACGRIGCCFCNIP
jgi:hypothetical protein